MDESTPLLLPVSAHHRKAGQNGYGRVIDHENEEEGWSPRVFFADALRSMHSHVDKPTIHLDPRQMQVKLKQYFSQAPEIIDTAVHALPAVLLGCLLNILDGVSCEYFFYVCHFVVICSFVQLAILESNSDSAASVVFPISPLHLL